MPFVFALFTFILVANMLGLLPLGDRSGLASLHTDQPLQHHRRAVADLSFSLVLIVGFWRTACISSRCSCRRDARWYMLPLIVPIEFVSFLVRPFSLALRLFVAMMAGHILMEVFGSFIVNGLNAAAPSASALGSSASCSSSASACSSCWSARSRPTSLPC